MVYTQGAFLWQIYTAPGKLLSKKKSSKASQTFDPVTRSVLNSGEILGPSITVSATGKYSPTDASATTLPKEIDVMISGGQLDIWGREIKLPIRGKGKFFIEYVDDAVRVFRSTGGGISVQVREDVLEKL